MQSDELRKLYSEIASIEKKMETLQGDLKHLRAKLDIAVQKYEKQTTEEITLDKALEPELTSPITESLEAIHIEAPTPILEKKQTQSQPIIVRPSLLQTETKKEQVVYKLKPVVVNQPIQKSEPPPDIFDDLKNWMKSKIGNIPVEEFLGINLLNKIGLVLLVIGFSFFLRHAYEWIGPFTKIIGMLLLSAGVYIGGNKVFKTQNYSIFGLGLIASSFALFYFTIYASYNIEATRILNPDQGLIGFILLVLSSVFIIGASLRYKMEVLTSFAYFLGFLTISINEKSDFNYFSMLTVGLLAVSLIVIMTVMKWKYLTGLGIVASYANYWLYAEGLPRTDAGYLLKISETGHNFYLESLLYLLFFWVIFFISTFTMKIEDKKGERVCTAVNIVNAFSFFVMLAYVKPEPTEWGPFLVNFSLGFVYTIGAFAGRKLGRDFLWNSSIVLGVTLITLSIPAKFSDYANIYGWLLEGTVLIALGFVYKETYLKSLGYIVLLMNLIKFYTLPYGNFFYVANENFPLISFDLNRGSLYILMILCFNGLVLFSKKFYRNWNKVDKIAYSFLGFLASFTLLLFSFYLIQKPFQSYILIPIAGIILYLAIYFRNRNFYYSSAGIMVVSFLVSPTLIFQNEQTISSTHSIICLSFILIGNSLQYYFAKHLPLLIRYSSNRQKEITRQNDFLHLKNFFLNGELFLWITLFSATGLILNNISAYLHSILLIGLACGYFWLTAQYKQGNKQGVSLFFVSFLVGVYRYNLNREDTSNVLNETSWIAIVNLFTFWIAGFIVLFYANQIKIKVETQKMLSPIFISATTLFAMFIGDILVEHPYKLSYAAIYSLLLILAFKKQEDLFFIYNSLTITFFTLALGLGDMIITKKDPSGIYEYMNLVTYAVTSFLTASLIFQFTTELFSRIFSYVQTILIGICFILVVVPIDYRSVAFALLHFAHLVFLFRFEMEKFYDYAYITLIISVLYFLNQTSFPSSSIETDSKKIILIFGYSILTALQSGFIIVNDKLSRNKIVYYLLTITVCFWSVHITMDLNYGIFLFAALVYLSGFLLNKYNVSEIAHTYYYPLFLSMFAFLALLISDKPNLLETMDYMNFGIGTFTLLLMLLGVRDVEEYKSKQPKFIQNKYSFEKIVTLVLFLEFILLTMTVVNVRFWSLIWALEAIGFIGYGVFRNQSLIRYAGIGLIALAVAKIIFWDLQNLKENVRVLVLISIGGLFVLASFLYAKFKDKLFKNND